MEAINATQIEEGDKFTVEYETNRSENTVERSGEVKEVDVTQEFGDTRTYITFINEDDEKAWVVSQVETGEDTWATVSATTDWADEGYRPGCNASGINRVSTRGGVVSFDVEHSEDEQTNELEPGTPVEIVGDKSHYNLANEWEILTQHNSGKVTIAEGNGVDTLTVCATEIEVQ